MWPPSAYIEPNPAGATGIVKKVPNWPGLSYEHAEAADDNLYWVVRFKRARKPENQIKGLSTVPDCARHFGLEARRLILGRPKTAGRDSRMVHQPGVRIGPVQVAGDGEASASILRSLSISAITCAGSPDPALTPCILSPDRRQAEPSPELESAVLMRRCQVAFSAAVRKTVACTPLIGD